MQGRGKREVYKVSLSVTKGVLSVEDVLDGDQVEGQGRNELTISSSSLKNLNDLLSKVTYTSTIYHIKTSDLATLTYEEHKAIFIIMIRRPSVPVLYDPGKDVNSQVTIITKTFLRYKELNILIASIRKFYPKIKIIVADDSLKPESVTGNNIEHYIMPPAQGKMARDMSDKDILKMELEQLQKEVKNTREPVSKTAKEICEWVEAQAAEDPLIKGVPEDKNPFKEKGGCIIT
ncbi:hypothetical protein QQF64_024491 [Cirrhinus molitorella]|uniref:Guanine nucleotide-binding protein subunit gamma n=1 Tax=Cirrhinus molitorella TaxID=172907 RepID=A0ABR3NLF1_9TELE